MPCLPLLLSLQTKLTTCLPAGDPASAGTSSRPFFKHALCTIVFLITMYCVGQFAITRKRDDSHCKDYTWTNAYPGVSFNLPLGADSDSITGWMNDLVIERYTGTCQSLSGACRLGDLTWGLRWLGDLHWETILKCSYKTTRGVTLYLVRMNFDTFNGGTLRIGFTPEYKYKDFTCLGKDLTKKPVFPSSEFYQALKWQNVRRSRTTMHDLITHLQHSHCAHLHQMCKPLKYEFRADQQGVANVANCQSIVFKAANFLSNNLWESEPRTILKISAGLQVPGFMKSKTGYSSSKSANTPHTNEKNSSQEISQPQSTNSLPTGIAFAGFGLLAILIAGTIWFWMRAGGQTDDTQQEEMYFGEDMV